MADTDEEYLQEKMLHELQSNVESEEKVWKDRLSSKDNELNKVKTDLDELSKKNQALNESLKVVKQAEEVRTYVSSSMLG